MKLGFWKLQVTTDIGNRGIGPYDMLNKYDQTRKTFLPFGFPLSAMMLPTHREYLYDVTDSSWGSTRF
jgi:hypothetical protein